MARLIFIRHGQAAFGSSSYDSLTPLGRRQARTLGAHFQTCGTTLHRVVSGELVRQRDTADLALAAMGSSQPIKPLSAFNEYDHMGIISAAYPLIKASDPELVQTLEAHFSNRSFQPFFEKVVSLWMGDMVLPEGVEGFAAFSGRVREGVTQLADSLEPHETVAVFTSGGVIAMALGMALGMAFGEAMTLSWSLRNGSFSTLHAGNGRLRLIDANVSAHLAEVDKGMVTYR